jgi:Xaa-Pro aminopeptidase
VSWSRDDAKLDRVRALMADRGLDALVVRAPDNVLYLTDYWCMKGYDLAIFPRQGDPTLVVLEAQAEEAARSWAGDIRCFAGYDAADPRPPLVRAVEVARAAVREHGYEQVGLELSLGTQAADIMVGEPTTYTRDFFDAFGPVEDATPLLVEARALKTEQEVERMRLANELAAEAMEHVRGLLRPGMTEAEAAAVWEGYVHGVGTGYRGKVELARAFTLVWSGPGIRTFTATGSRPVVEGQPTLFEIWVCCDGYWADHTKNLCVGALEPRYAELLEGLQGVYDDAVSSLRDGGDLAELDRGIREGIDALGYPGQPSHPICHGVGARAHEPPYAHQAAGGAMRAGMVLAVEPGIYWEGGGGLRLEDNFLVTADGAEKLSPFPDGVVAVEGAGRER